ALAYTAKVAPAIAYPLQDVDRAPQWALGWGLGRSPPSAAIGARAVMNPASAAGGHAASAGVAPRVQSVIDARADRFREGLTPPAASDLLILRSAREQQRIVKKNAGASLVDLGEGVLAVEFHSKMNALGGDTMSMLQAGVKEAS